MVILLFFFLHLSSTRIASFCLVLAGLFYWCGHVLLSNRRHRCRRRIVDVASDRPGPDSVALQRFLNLSSRGGKKGRGRCRCWFCCFYTFHCENSFWIKKGSGLRTLFHSFIKKFDTCWCERRRERGESRPYDDDDDDDDDDMHTSKRTRKQQTPSARCRTVNNGLLFSFFGFKDLILKCIEKRSYAILDDGIGEIVLRSCVVDNVGFVS
jgi:hypothetical protein